MNSRVLIALIAVVVLTSCFAHCLAQSSITVESGQTITEADLHAGVFGGVAFTLGTDTVIEVNDGGKIGPIFDSFDFGGSTVNINHGGSFETPPQFTSSSEVWNIRLNLLAGGRIGEHFDVDRGSAVNVTGGSIGSGFEVGSRSTFNIYEGHVGGTFRAWGGSTVNIFGGDFGDHFAAFIRSTVNIHGGNVGNSFRARPNSTVNVLGGTIGSQMDAESDSTVNISGGSVGSGFDAKARSTVNISGGNVGRIFEAEIGSTVNISDGAIGPEFFARSGSMVNMSGGSLGEDFLLSANSRFKITGGEFQSNGVDVVGERSGVGFENVFTGTFANGTPFIFAGPASDFGSFDLVRVPLPTVDLASMVIDSNAGAKTYGLRAGQHLTLENGGELGENFAIVDAALVVNGGSIGNQLEVAGAEVVIAGGSVGDGFDVYAESAVSIFDGTIGNMNAHQGSIVNIFGGRTGSFTANTGSNIHVSGGAFTNFYAKSGSSVNLTVTELVLNGFQQEITPGRPLAIDTNDDFMLEVILADGSPLELTRNSFAAGADLTVTLVPEPRSLLVLAWGMLPISRRNYS